MALWALLGWFQRVSQSKGSSVCPFLPRLSQAVNQTVIPAIYPGIVCSLLSISPSSQSGTTRVN